ncbi:hypothetical protein BD779DRAFT_1478289 [Infundibulicybe gibba]|nr:hypothetical protein BD779DRAFT_1478289 [Infundibulicybe gibba]
MFVKLTSQIAGGGVCRASHISIMEGFDYTKTSTSACEHTPPPTAWIPHIATAGLCVGHSRPDPCCLAASLTVCLHATLEFADGLSFHPTGSKPTLPLIDSLDCCAFQPRVLLASLCIGVGGVDGRLVCPGMGKCVPTDPSTFYQLWCSIMLLLGVWIVADSITTSKATTTEPPAVPPLANITSGMPLLGAWITADSVTTSRATTTGPPALTTWTSVPPLANITSGMPPLLVTATFPADAKPSYSGVPSLLISRSHSFTYSTENNN